MKTEVAKNKSTNNNKVLYKAIGLIIFLFLVVTAVQAQGIPGPPSFPSSPSKAPIDGGLGLLAAAGGTYAWKKLRDKKEE